MAYFEANPNIANTVLIAIGIALIVGVLVVLTIKIVKAVRDARRARQEGLRLQHQQEIDQGVQRALLEIRNEYLVMARNTTYVVGPEGEIAIGKYLLTNSVSNETTFNVRLNGLVRQFSNGDIVMLNGGDTICPVSGAVLIKPYVDEKIHDENK